MASRVETFLQRSERTFAKRGSFPNHWQDIADFVMPHKSDIISTREPGSERADRVLDSTAIHARTLLSASMNGAICPPGVVWHTLKLRDEKLNQDVKAQNWLEECTKRMHLARRQSNFNTEAGEWFDDYCGFHTANLYVEERNERNSGLDAQFGEMFNGFNYRAVPINEYAIDENASGMVDVVFRQFKMSLHAAKQKFGEKGLGEKLTEQCRKKPEEEMEIVHGVYPRDGYREGRPGAKNMRFESCYVAKKEKRILAEGGYEEFPYAVARWQKGSDGMWGTGPSFTALPEIRTLNRVREMILRAAGKAIDPPMLQVNDGVQGDVNTGAGGTTIVESKDSLTPMESGAKFDVAGIVLADCRQLIRDIFFYQQLQLQEGAQMTATEILKRLEMMQRMLGPTFGRVEHEGLNQFVNREFNIMMRRGAFPPVPEVLSGQDIDIEYEGPLARAQRAQTMHAFAEWFSLVAPLAQLKPEVLDNLDFDAAAIELADIAGIPSKFRNSEDAKFKIRTERAQAEAAAQKNQMLMGVAESAGKAAPALREINNMRALPGGQSQQAEAA